MRAAAPFRDSAALAPGDPNSVSHWCVLPRVAGQVAVASEGLAAALRDMPAEPQSGRGRKTAFTSVSIGTELA